MLSSLRNLFSPKPIRRRALDGGAGGSRWQNAQTVSNLNSTIFASSKTLAQRAEYLVHNDPVAAAGVRSLVANLVGTGFKPQSKHPSKDTASRIESAFLGLPDSKDGGGFSSFFLLAAVRTLITQGEVFLRAVPGPVFRVDVLHPDQVPMDLHRDLSNGRKIRAGVEFDAAGRRVAYHIYKTRPGDVVQPMNSLETVRVEAQYISHVFDRLSPGQVRGLSWFSPIMLKLHEHAQLADAVLVKQKVAALFAGVLTDIDGQGSPLNDNVSNGQAAPGLEPGTILPLQPGQDIKFTPTPSTTDYPEFQKALLRSIAAGLGLTYEQLSGDLEGVNYSSIRAGLIEFRRRAEQIQKMILIDQMYKPIWHWFVQNEVLAGRFPMSDMDNLLNVDWLPPAWDWVDPLKDMQAEQLAVDAGFKSRRQVIAETGRDIEDVDAEIVSDPMKSSQKQKVSEQ